MNIAMIGQKGMPARFGGVERHVHELSTRLVKEGHDVTVYSRSWYTKSEDGTIEGVRTKHINSIKTKHLDTITHTLFASIHALFQGYDVIHYHGVGPALVSWIPRVFTPNTRVITTFHSIDRYQKKWNIFAKLMLRLGEWAACKFSHETITISRGLHRYCQDEYQTATHYIPNGVAEYTHASRTMYTESFGLEKDNYLVMVARLIKDKGAHILVDAFKKLKENHKDNPEIQKLKLAIVGGPVYTDDYVRDLHQQGSACNDIVFTDFQHGDALNELYSHARALVHPSFHEGLPLTVLEAMGYEKPVMVSNIPEHLELIADARFVFERDNVDALYETLREFLQLDAKTLQHVGEKNKRQVQDEYGWDAIVSETQQLYAASKKKQTTTVAQTTSFNF